MRSQLCAARTSHAAALAAGDQRTFMKPNSTMTTINKNFSFVTMSPGLRLVMSLSEQVLILGVRADAKSVSCTGF